MGAETWRGKRGETGGRESRLLPKAGEGRWRNQDLLKLRRSQGLRSVCALACERRPEALGAAVPAETRLGLEVDGALGGGSGKEALARRKKAQPMELLKLRRSRRSRSVCETCLRTRRAALGAAVPAETRFGLEVDGALSGELGKKALALEHSSLAETETANSREERRQHMTDQQGFLSKTVCYRTVAPSRQNRQTRPSLLSQLAIAQVKFRAPYTLFETVFVSNYHTKSCLHSVAIVIVTSLQCHICLCHDVRART